MTRILRQLDCIDGVRHKNHIQSERHDWSFTWMRYQSFKNRICLCGALIVPYTSPYWERILSASLKLYMVMSLSQGKQLPPDVNTAWGWWANLIWPLLLFRANMDASRAVDDQSSMIHIHDWYQSIVRYTISNYKALKIQDFSKFNPRDSESLFVNMWPGNMSSAKLLIRNDMLTARMLRTHASLMAWHVIAQHSIKSSVRNTKKCY